MRIHIPHDTECQVVNYTNDNRTVTVPKGTYVVRGSQGIDFRIEINLNDEGLLDVLVKFLDAREIY